MWRLIVRAVTVRTTPHAFRREVCGVFAFYGLLQGRLTPKASRSKRRQTPLPTVQSLQYIYYCTYWFSMHTEYFRILNQYVQKYCNKKCKNTVKKKGVKIQKRESNPRPDRHITTEECQGVRRHCSKHQNLIKSKERREPFVV